MGFAKDAVAEAERSADVGGGRECSPADLDVEADTMCMKVLDEARAVLAAAEPMVSNDDFKTHVLGGGWTFAHKGGGLRRIRWLGARRSCHDLLST